MTSEPTSAICRDCGDAFTLAPGEIDFYVARGLSVPKRCKPCRLARRATRALEDGAGA